MASFSHIHDSDRESYSSRATFVINAKLFEFQAILCTDINNMT